VCPQSPSAGAQHKARSAGGATRHRGHSGGALGPGERLVHPQALPGSWSPWWPLVLFSHSCFWGSGPSQEVVQAVEGAREGAETGHLINIHLTLFHSYRYMQYRLLRWMEQQTSAYIHLHEQKNI